MQYVLAVKGEVYGSQAAYLAYQFAEQLLASGHENTPDFLFPKRCKQCEYVGQSRKR